MQLATIEALDSPRQFTLHWQPDQQYPAMTLVTTFVLEEENGGTRVTVTETGFEALPDDIRQQRFDSTAAGYETVMPGLKAYVERVNP